MLFSKKETTKEITRWRIVQASSKCNLVCCMFLTIKQPNRCISFHRGREKRDYVSSAATIVKGIKNRTQAKARTTGNASFSGLCSAKATLLSHCELNAQEGH